jgi:hypothetical protein
LYVATVLTDGRFDFGRLGSRLQNFKALMQRSQPLAAPAPPRFGEDACVNPDCQAPVAEKCGGCGRMACKRHCELRDGAYFCDYCASSVKSAERRDALWQEFVQACKPNRWMSFGASFTLILPLAALLAFGDGGVAFPFVVLAGVLGFLVAWGLGWFKPINMGPGRKALAWLVAAPGLLIPESLSP